MSGNDKPNVRAIAVQCIHPWLVDRPHADELLRDAGAHRAVLMEIVYGVIRRRRTLDWLIGRMTHHKPDAPVTALLMTGLYQLLWMNEPDYAVVNETVSIATRMCGRPRASMVNAVLRRLVRERDEWVAAIEKAPAGVRESHPNLLVNRWNRQYGKAEALRIMEWNNEPAAVTIRRLAGRISHEDFRAHNDNLVPHPFRSEWYYTVPRGKRVFKLDGFLQGQFIVQDPATTAAVELLEAQPGESVWDACAAPGGKTIALADAMQDRGHVVATDCDARRLELVRENMNRTGFHCIETMQWDATASPPQKAAFDAVLLDVPCTNTGVLRRRPDARWRFDEKSLKKAVSLQKRLLNNCASAIKPGGRLVYSTCSIEPEENGKLIAAWLKKHPGFTLEKEIRLLPGQHGTDGAYAARLNVER